MLIEFVQIKNSLQLHLITLLRKRLCPRKFVSHILTVLYVSVYVFNITCENSYIDHTVVILYMTTCVQQLLLVESCDLNYILSMIKKLNLVQTFLQQQIEMSTDKARHMTQNISGKIAIISALSTSPSHGWCVCESPQDHTCTTC